MRSVKGLSARSSVSSSGLISSMAIRNKSSVLGNQSHSKAVRQVKVPIVVKRSPGRLRSTEHSKEQRRTTTAIASNPAFSAGEVIGRIWLAIQAFVSWAIVIFTTGDPTPLEPIENQLSPKAQRFRVGLLAFCCLILTVGIVARLYFLQGQQKEIWTKLADRQHVAKLEVQGARGNILDRNGRTLGTSVETLSIAAHPSLIKNREVAYEKLAQVLEVSKESISKKFETGKNFVWVAQGLPAAKREELAKLRLAGVSLLPEFERYYPQGKLAGPLMGTVGREGKGLSGLELQFDNFLSATSLKFALGRDARGNFITADAWNGVGKVALNSSASSLIRPITQRIDNFSGPTTEAESPQGGMNSDDLVTRQEGGEIVLTIDSVLQSIMEQELEQGVTDSKAKRAFSILMDAENGEILALAQAPGLDPNQKRGLSSDQLRNFLLQDSFEPGSTMKPLVAAAAADKGKVGLEEIMNCEHGKYRVGRHLIRDVHPIDIVPLRDVLVRSSNVCMAKIGQRMGAKLLRQTFVELGFGSKTGIELPGEEKGILRSAQNWKEIDTATGSFGQGIAVTGLQLVTAYAALANRGVLPTPSIVRQEGVKQGQQVFKPEVAERIADYLKGVTEDDEGTAKKARISGVSVAGKTGTAQKPVIGGRGYRQDAVLSSFIGFVNGNELGIGKRLVAFVVVDEPGVYPRWGGVVAAPIFKRSMERILAHLVTRQNVQTAAIPPGRKAG